MGLIGGEGQARLTAKAQLSPELAGAACIVRTRRQLKAREKCSSAGFIASDRPPLPGHTRYPCFPWRSSIPGPHPYPFTCWPGLRPFQHVPDNLVSPLRRLSRASISNPARKKLNTHKTAYSPNADYFFYIQ